MNGVVAPVILREIGTAAAWTKANDLTADPNGGSLFTILNCNHLRYPIHP